MSQRERLLIVDDDALMRRSLARMLRPFDVVAVASAEAALELIEGGERFDVVLTDLKLGGGLSGGDFVARVAAKTPELAARTVLMSGLPPSSEDVAVMRLIGDRWLLKPFTLADLLAVTARFAGRFALSA